MASVDWCPVADRHPIEALASWTVTFGPNWQERRSQCGVAPWTRLLEQFVAIPPGNPRDDHGAGLVLTVRLRPGTVKRDRPRQSLQLGFGQRIAELLAVCRRAGALDGVDGHLQGLIPADRIDCGLLRKTLVVGDTLLHQGVGARQVERDGPVDGPFDFAIGQVPIGWILEDPTLHVIQHTDRNLLSWDIRGIRSTVSAFASMAGRDAPVARSSTSRSGRVC